VFASGVAVPCGHCHASAWPEALRADLSAPLAGIQLPFATLRRYLPGVGLCSLNCASFPLFCFQLQRFQKTGTLAERTDKQPGIPGTQQMNSPDKK
jgi:hypothetical protein